MESVKDILNFCKAAISHDNKNIGIIEELNQARRCVFNLFHETIPFSRILITLSFIDVVISKMIMISKMLLKILTVQDQIYYV